MKPSFLRRRFELDPVQANSGQAIFAEQRTEISLNRLNVDERADCTETSESVSIQDSWVSHIQKKKLCALLSVVRFHTQGFHGTKQSNKHTVKVCFCLKFALFLFIVFIKYWLWHQMLLLKKKIISLIRYNQVQASLCNKNCAENCMATPTDSSCSDTTLDDTADSLPQKVGIRFDFSSEQAWIII